MSHLWEVKTLKYVDTTVTTVGRMMNLQIRHYLIFLLVLLQFVAPLIHAHKNSVTNFGTSIHLPEFEYVNTLLKHAPEFIAPTSNSEEIIAISTGIKNKIKPLLQTENGIFLLFLSVFLMAKKQPELRCFSSQTEPIPNRYFFNTASPRAPPFFPF